MRQSLRRDSLRRVVNYEAAKIRKNNSIHQRFFTVGGNIRNQLHSQTRRFIDEIHATVTKVSIPFGRDIHLPMFLKKCSLKC